MYVKRDSSGKIVAISKIHDDGANEFMEDDDPELQIFMRSLKTYQQQALAQTDKTMARVVEDVINVLVEKNLIRFTDLPDAAQLKLLARRELRGKKKGIDLLDDENDNLNLQLRLLNSRPGKSIQP